MSFKKVNYDYFEIDELRDFRELISRAKEKYKTKLSFYEKDNNDNYVGISFEDFYNYISYLGEGLLSLKNINQRDKIALIGRNCRKWAISYLAITTSNFIVVPIDKELKDFEIDSIIRKANCKAIIFENKFFEILNNIQLNNPNLIYLIPFENDHRSEFSFDKLISLGIEKCKIDSIYNKININPNEVTSILFTSGTTGIPKGVMLSQKNILSNIRQMRSLYWIDENDTFLSVLPLHHSYECTCGFLCQIHSGSSIYYAQSLKKIADNLRESKATIMLGVPLLFESFYKRIIEVGFSGILGKIKYFIATLICDIFEGIFKKNIRRKVFKKIHDKFGGKLQRFISGGAALPKEVEKFFNKIGIILCQGYGITECSPLLSVNRIEKDKYLEYKISSVGKIASDVDIKIFDQDLNGIGEIGAKGPNIMLGYYDDPESTEKAFNEGYFLTGDYGFIDKEGFLFISGRKKDVIITKNGKNVYPEEIEYFYNNSEYISEIIVKEGKEPVTGDPVIISIIRPNFENFSKILNVPFEEIQRREILDKNINFIIEQIRKEIKENNKKLPPFKMIKYFYITFTEFERTTTKKVKRYKIIPKGPIYNVY
ncbi:MAG: AMP-binding protein [Spirochaetes bacterium]|nr:AMP-binding protein [Spirochaetota bacterium]